MKLNYLALLSLAAFALVTAPSAVAEPSEIFDESASDSIAQPSVRVPCVLYAEEIEIGGTIRIREVEVGNC